MKNTKKQKRTKRPDFTLDNEGSIFLLTPNNKRASSWITKNVQVESWQRFGKGVAVDQRYVDDLVNGIQEAGFVVE